MSTYAYLSDIDGRPITIENPLLPEHIRVGQLLWYEGFTSTFEWSCPAIITKVIKSRKVFRVRSLDDMREQTQEYAFDAADDQSTSRKSMRLVNMMGVKTYIEKRKLVFERSVESAKEALSAEEQKLAHFNEVLATLDL